MAEQAGTALGTPIAALPLRTVRHRAKITGLQLEDEVTQEYGNELKGPVEAVYVFPLPAEAAVLGVEMRIGQKRIVSEIRKREDAVREYEEARDTGHHAALLEQERPNIFTMSVAGIEPGEAISVTVRILAPVSWQDSGGRLSLPLVVAPRFIPGVPAEGKSKGRGWAPDTDMVPDASRITPKLAESVGYSASAEISLTPGFPCHIESPSHGAMVTGSDLAEGKTGTFRLENLRPDRDVILTYRTTSSLPTVKVDRSRFTPPKGATEEFVLLQLTPGAGQAPVSPLDVVLVLDKSESMDGPKITGLKQIGSKTLDRLAAFSRPVRVGCVVYDDTIHAKLKLAAIGKGHRSTIQDIPVRGGGGTNTHEALDAAVQLFGTEDDDRERCVIIVTDGQFGGEWSAKRKGVRIHVVGIDTAVNDAFLNDLARKSGGGTYFLRPGEDYDAAAGAITAFASGPVVRGVELRGLPKEAVVTGLSDLYASRPTTIAVQLPKVIRGFTVTGSGTDGKPHEWAIAVPDAPTTEVAATLWARMQLKDMEDRDAQVALSLRYGVVCSATAFVAVSLKEVPGAKPERVDIPVLLPETWNAEAFRGAFAGAAACRRVSISALSLAGSPASAAFAGGFGLGAPSRSRGGFLDGIRRVAGSMLPSRPPMTPPKAPTPKAPPPSTGGSRPQLLVDAEAFLGKLKTGKAVGKGDWKHITQALAAEAKTSFTGWSELDRSRLYEVLVTLRPYGYTVDIPATLQTEPTDVDARRNWRRARQALGHATP